ncbi:MAG: hypothetical protein KAT71_08410, partial [Gammaproteobacteria bacterium]|nr:hypothetical protein [Gammaproteobacteria bacterium]
KDGSNKENDMDYMKSVDQIVETMKRGGHPLSDKQRILITELICINLDSADIEGRSCQAKFESQARDKFIAAIGE